ncbi:hypothetical protein BCF58_2278 [Chryseobacterium defluvii]|uniref:Uncharacterized protein n=1 Tax=Chryseobacterium defluvii TaxID=160396 RepID=A0A495SEU0_9FLAO|nr:hypothetical protein BCF58_2278 [Chryseobacterium defluvii]
MKRKFLITIHFDYNNIAFASPLDLNFQFNPSNVISILNLSLADYKSTVFLFC